MLTKEQVTEALRPVIDPELRQSIVDLGMVRSIDIYKGGARVDVVVSLTTPGCPIRSHFQTAVVEQVSALEGVRHVAVGFDVLSQQEKQGLQQKLGRGVVLPADVFRRQCRSTSPPSAGGAFGPRRLLLLDPLPE